MNYKLLNLYLKVAEKSINSNSKKGDQKVLNANLTIINEFSRQLA